MAQQLGAGAIEQFEQATREGIKQATQQAAQQLLTGGQQYEQRLQQAMPAARQALMAQAAQGLAAGAMQSGRGRASAYGGALEGGLRAAQQLAGFEMKGAQALADAAKMQAEGFAAQATAGEKAMQLGTLETQRQQTMANINQQVSTILGNTVGKAAFGTDDIAGMTAQFDALVNMYAPGTYGRAVARRERDRALKNYTGVDKNVEPAPLEIYLAEEGVQ